MPQQLRTDEVLTDCDGSLTCYSIFSDGTGPISKTWDGLRLIVDVNLVVFPAKSSMTGLNKLFTGRKAAIDGSCQARLQRHSGASTGDHLIVVEQKISVDQTDPSHTDNAGPPSITERSAGTAWCGSRRRSHGDARANIWDE